MATANTAEVLKLAAKPVQNDNDEKTWLEFRFKLEHYLTLVDESQNVANLPTGTEEQALTIRTLSHTLHALLATRTNGRSVRLPHGLQHRESPTRGFRRVLGCQLSPRFEPVSVRHSLHHPAMSDNPAAKFEETWKSWEHQVDIYENLASTKLDDDVKISVDIGKGKGKGKSKSKSKGNGKSGSNGKGKSKGKSKDRNQGKGKNKNISKGKGSGKPDNDKECYVCGKKVISHETVGHEPITTRR